MYATRPRLDGIGSPSKYLDLPLASLGRLAIVALNRASLAKPAHTNPMSINMSIFDLNPIAKARKAGATPKLIKSANESSSWPSIDEDFLQRATLPSRASKMNPQAGRVRAA